MRRLLLRHVHVCLVTAAAGLAGCGGGEGPPPIEPPPIDAPIDSPDATDTPPPMPSALILTGGPIDFGDIVVARTSEPSTLTLRNTGTGPTGAVTISITGTQAGDFNFGAAECNDLAPEATCQISVTFSPGDADERSASLRAVAANGGESSVLLHGNGVPDIARLAIGPTPHDFGAVVEDRQSAPTVFTVENEGTAASGELSISLANGDDDDFTIEPPLAGDCINGITTLAGGARCNVRVRFAPRDTGLHEVDLLVSATPGDNAIAALRGTGTPPGEAALTLSPSMASFGTVGVGQSSQPTLFTLTNTGESTTDTITLQLLSPLFAISGSNCPQTLDPGDDCTFNVIYTPTIAGGVDGALADGATVTARCAGIAVEPSSTLSGTGSATLGVTISAAGAAGRVTSTPAGIDCTAGTCQGTFTRNTVTLQAAAGAGSGFAGWMGACFGELTASCTVTMNAARSATAMFVPLRRLTVNASSGGTVTSAPAGVNCPGDCTNDYLHGTVVTLTATPAPGYRFDAWSVAGCTNTTCVLTMNAATTVTATFVQQFTLTVNARDLGVSSGSSVTVRPSIGAASTCTSGPAAGTTCTYVYDRGIDVVLERTLGASTSFQGWAADCSGTGACGPLIMNADHDVDATFAAYRAVITLAGNGKVAISPSGTLCPDTSCNPVFPGGTIVTLTPQPSAGAAFWAWSSGDCTGTGTCQLLMGSNKTMTAEFRTARNLTVTKSGSGSITSNPMGIDCASGCASQTAAFPDGRTVTLTASPAAGYVFGAWGGACAGQTGNCVLNMNAAASASASFTPGTDLVVESVSCAPDPVAPGAAISCSVSVRNDGTTPSGAFINRLALSADTVIDGGDAQLGTCNLGSISPGASAQVTCGGTIAAATTAGNYFAGVMADHTAVVPETNEANNTGSDAIAVSRPDITVTQIACNPEPATPGGAVSCQVTFANSGAAAGGFTYDVRLSADTAIDTTDPLILNCTNSGGVPAVGTAQATCAGTLPHALGNYRIGVIADRGAAVTETSETNNTGSSPIRIGTDLVISGLSCTDGQYPHQEASCTYTITNLGAAVPAFTTAIRLSSDSTIDGNDGIIAGCHTPGMAVGATLTQTCVASIPPSATNLYWMGVIVDAGDVIAEWDFSAPGNNNLATELFVLQGFGDADLQASTPVCTPSLVGPGAPLSCNVIVTNRNAGAAPASTLVLRHSGTPGGVSSTSAVLASCTVPALAGGTATPVTCAGTGPASTGVRYTSAWVDSAGVVTETDETNNESAESSFSVAAAGADLDVITVACPDLAGPGSTIECDVTILNRGTSATVPFASRIVRSTDTSITSGDSPNADCAAPNGIPGLGMITLRCPITLTGVGTSTPYIGVLLDTGANVTETDEGNNTGYDQIAVVGTGVDLDVDSSQLRCTADQVVQGGQVACSVTIINRGTGTAAATRTGLSMNSVPIGDCPTPSIPGLGSVRVECLGTIPLGVAPSSTSLVVTADSALQVSETSETNNTDNQSMRVLLNAVDLEARALYCWGVGSLGVCMVTVANLGGVAAAPHRISIRQSADAAVDANDPQVGSCNAPALAPWGTAVHRCVFTLTDASVNVGAIVDADAAVAEAVETNNLVAGTGGWIFANLTLTNLACSYSSSNGGTATCTGTVNNLSQAPAGPFDVTVRKSSNSTWDLTDTFVASITVPGLAPGASQAVTLTAQSSHSTPYIVGKVDELLAVPESSETDNTTFDTW